MPKRKRVAKQPLGFGWTRARIVNYEARQPKQLLNIDWQNVRGFPKHSQYRKDTAATLRQRRADLKSRIAKMSDSALRNSLAKRVIKYVPYKARRKKKTP